MLVEGERYFCSWAHPESRVGYSFDENQIGGSSAPWRGPYSMFLQGQRLRALRYFLVQFLFLPYTVILLALVVGPPFAALFLFESNSNTAVAVLAFRWLASVLGARPDSAAERLFASLPCCSRVLCSLLAALAGYRSPKTFSFSPVCLDAACIVRSGTFPHASNLVYIYIYI